ncbi:MAG: carboxypeptidase-like regulatory domain-containing protein [Candidatus Micrarchaeota archaeon]
MSYAYGYDCSTPDNDEPSPDNPLDVSIDPSCDGTVITVTSGGAVPGADVDVIAQYGPSIFSGTTDSNGQVTLDPDACGLTVRVYADKDGYNSYNGDPTTIDCGTCGPEGCQSNDDCASDKKCNLDTHECVGVPCECGVVQNHQCVPYACCSDSQCATGEICDNHICKEKPAFECTSDVQCAPTQYCDIPVGASGGSCKDVTGQCGQVVDHAFVPYGYECGTEEGCPSCGNGFACVDHKCIQNDVTCPTTGLVGDKKTCEATENGQPCVLCDFVYTDPTGKNFTGKTDENGNFDLPLNMEGIYKVALMKNGTIVKIIEVKAFPQGQPPEPEKPGQAGPDLGAMLALVVLLLLLVLGILYWRSRGKKK